MSFEQHWHLERCHRQDVLAAVLEVADRHDLRFWAHSDGDGEIVVWMQFPVDGAAELACALADLYTSPEEAAPELQRIEGERYTCVFELDWERDHALGVYADENDNRAGWPLIVAFTDAVASVLGGSWVDP